MGSRSRFDVPRGFVALSASDPIQLFNQARGGRQMPRYIVERTFPSGLTLPTTEEGAKAALSVIDNNAELGVTWVQSYVTPDREATFCLYDGPSEDAIRAAAEKNGMNAVRVTEVRVLDPYF